MKLHEHIQQRMNLVGRYGATGIEVHGQLLAGPVILAPGFLQPQWIGSAAELAVEALEPVWPLEPRIVLLGGSGFPPAAVKALRSALTARQAALEVMDLGAACRTYNVLAQEDRPVVALLFPS
jgi:uncharacterized protein